MPEQFRVAIIGASGYTGGELMRLVYLHPHLQLAYCYSQTYAGQSIAAVHPDLFFLQDMHFTDTFSTEVDALFLAVSHGAARPFLEKHSIPQDLPVIDLSRDFRLERNQFTYGLPEAFAEQIQTAHRVANPGCFATAIQLALLPLAAEGLLTSPIHIYAITGSSGAGKSLKETTHFTWRYGNVSVYAPFNHPHLPEIEATLQTLQSTPLPEINFIPMRGNFTRGIYATLYLEAPSSPELMQALYYQFYKNKPFVFLSDTIPSIKEVVNTNYALLHLHQSGNKLMIISVIDNLLKGAAGQAIQNLNLMLNLPETTGLMLKPSAY